MISLWVVNSINHPEFKRTVVTSFLHPFFNSITFIPTCIATFLNLFLINLCCPSPTSRSIIFNLPPSPPPLSLLSFLSSLPRFHLRLFFFGRRHKGRVRLWGRLLPIRNQAWNHFNNFSFFFISTAHHIQQDSPHQFYYCCQMANGKCSKIYFCTQSDCCFHKRSTAFYPDILLRQVCIYVQNMQKDTTRPKPC